jgi:uncharacterized repeat protein (TIGR01451 family)
VILTSRQTFHNVTVAAITGAIAVVGACAPAGAAPGSWSRGGPEGGPITGLAFDPSASTTVYAATRYNGVFRSTDGGSGWLVASDPTLPGGIQALAIAADGALFAAAGFGALGVFKSSDGGSSWDLVHGAEVIDLETDPSSPLTVYAASVGQGVLKSTDGGSTWTSSTSGIAEATILSLAVAPSSPSTLYLGTLGDGVFKSTDAGLTWTKASSGTPFDTVNNLVVHPSEASTVYVATGFESLYKTTNGGTTWTPANAGLPLNIEGLAIDPSAPSRLFVSAFGRIFRSTDGGGSWSELSGGIPGAEIGVLAVDPASSDRVFAGAGSGVLLSVNGGDGWSGMNSGLEAVFVDRLVTDPTAPETLFATSPESGLFKTIDGGLSWHPASSGITDLRIDALALAPSEPQILFAASAGELVGDIYRSDDGGSNWSSPIADPADFGSFGPQARSLAVDPTNAATVLAGNSGTGGMFGTGGLFRSLDGGISWEKRFEPDSSLRRFEPTALSVASALPSRIFAGYQALSVLPPPSSAAILRSENGGADWTEVLQVEGEISKVELEIDPFDPDTVFALFFESDSTQVFRTTNGGDGWQPFAVGTPCVHDLLPDPLTPGAIWAGCDSVFVSEDSGASWDMFDDTGFPANRGGARELAVALTDPATIHAGTFAGVFSYTVLPPTDLSITKEVAVGERNPGEPVTYIIEVENHGVEGALGATVQDSLPTALTSCGWTCIGSGGGLCTAAGAGDIENEVDLPGGATVTYTVECTVAAGAGGIVSNTASVIPPADVDDPDPSNDSDSAEFVVLEIGPCGVFNDRFLQNLTITTTEIFQACSSIRAGPGFQVLSPGDATLEAPLVVLDRGVTIGANARLTIVNRTPTP